MAKPRIFISSTYYDLKHIRSDLERYIFEQGYDAVMNEKGHIPYGSTEKLEEYCYKEIELCDILVAVIGGRFGSESKEKDYSVSNLELKTAREKGKQVYIFIEKSVASEYKTYEANKNVKGLSFTAVTDVRVYKFLDEVYSLTLNNQIQTFESAKDIISYLKEQWAGLFQRLLSDEARQKEVDLISDLKNTSKTLNQLVEYLVSEKSKGESAVSDILLSNHPAFNEIKTKLDIPYRIIFQNKKELDQVLSARRFEEGMEVFDNWVRSNCYSWRHTEKDLILHVKQSIFDSDESLRIYTPNEWDPSWVELEDLDFDIPF
ncbi:DUF4062 domain-containing protein [Vibrio ruber]|uniref:DUF4062 domain-containing protein n=1 Tax=Vibrio ruber TaxID=184755 RepID=UPI002892A1C4|nr:DUF4062 domain-containing protein [Vibrio ruber]WNJ98040.1 DUF4062 domain-containing protein [Vibrio ruber]